MPLDIEYQAFHPPILPGAKLMRCGGFDVNIASNSQREPNLIKPGIPVKEIHESE